MCIRDRWNTLEEELRDNAGTKTLSVAGTSQNASSFPVPINEICTEEEERYLTGLKELDRVLGGGIVKGSLILISGDPGIGKSTILLQICQYLGKKLKILYISGEESKRQLKLRASRLGVSSSNLYKMCIRDRESPVWQ